MVTDTLPPLVVIAGPTGVGKSACSLQLAQMLGGEIVNADSMQIYRGMDIGTAKVAAAERELVPHHLFDILTVNQTASVAAYQRDARQIITAIRARGAVPILVGGSGLYIQSVIDEIEFPGTDPLVRHQLQTELEEHGIAVLFQRLQQADPQAAAAISPQNGRRIVRALEVIAITGRPFTATLPAFGQPRYDAQLIYLDHETSTLDDRLAERVDQMMAAGFLDEVRALEKQGIRQGLTASRAVGYRQMLSYLADEISLEEAVRATVVATRRLVRRQRSWFLKDSRWQQCDTADPQLTSHIQRIIG